MNNTTALNLPPIFDMVATIDLKPALEAAMTQGSIEVAAADVQRVTTPGLQLLAAAAKACAQRGLSFSIANCSSPLREAAEALDLASALGLGEDPNE